MNTLGLISSFAIFSHISTIFEMLPFIIQIFGLRYYIIQGDKDKIRLITKKLEKETISSSSRLTNGKTVPSNYFIGFKCIGYFDNTSRFSEDTKVYVITFKSHYDYLLQDKDISLDLNTIFIEDGIKIAEEKQVLLPEVKKNTGKIQMFNRIGEYKNFYYRPIKLDISELSPLGDQMPILEGIIELYRKKKRGSIFIHGVPGAGKSSVGYLLAKELNGIFSHSFNPTDPGDNLSNLLGELSGYDCDEGIVPKILVLEEADIMIKSIHENTVRHIRDIPTPVHNKATWSTFLDDMVFHKHLILILTSNSSKEEIDKMDKSYLREGRIDKYYSMMTALTV